MITNYIHGCVIVIQIPIYERNLRDFERDPRNFEKLQIFHNV